MADAKAARAEQQRMFTLTDRLHARLENVGPRAAAIDVRMTLAPPAGGDVEGLAFLVLMRAAETAQEDLEAIMEDVRAINEAKAKQRRLLDERDPLLAADAEEALDVDAVVGLLGALLAREIESDARELGAGIDALGELGEIESLRLQIQMDRLSKLMSTLSNILKKLSDTQRTIVQNLK